MKYLNTLKDLDPLYQKKLDDLRELVTLAGGVRRLAALLGLDHKTVDAWGRAGQISPRGAALVHSSVELGRFYACEDLRPDISTDKWRQVFGSVPFKRALATQKNYELEAGKLRTVESPIEVVLKVVARSENG